MIWPETGPVLVSALSFSFKRAFIPVEIWQPVNMQSIKSSAQDFTNVLHAPPALGLQDNIAILLLNQPCSPSECTLGPESYCAFWGCILCTAVHYIMAAIFSTEVPVGMRTNSSCRNRDLKTGLAVQVRPMRHGASGWHRAHNVKLFPRCF